MRRFAASSPVSDYRNVPNADAEFPVTLDDTAV